MLSATLPGRVSAQRLAVEIRAGVVASTALAEQGATGVFPGGDRGRPASVVARPDPAPLVVIAAQAGVRPGLSLEAAAGWTFAELVGRQDDASWVIQDLGIGHAVLALRYRVAERFHARGGVGAIRYASDGGGLFSGGSEVEPMLELGAGAEWRAGRARITLDALAQVHSFGTPALRGGGGSGSVGADGTVYRAAIQAGVALGSWTP